MLLEMLQLTYQLILFGFYSVHELSDHMGGILARMDGRQDRLYESEDGPSNLRFTKLAATDCNTVVMMECKLWCCRILQLVCTVRLDVRLSKLLGIYSRARAKRCASDTPPLCPLAPLPDVSRTSALPC